MSKDHPLSDALNQLKAIGDPTRARILLCLEGRPLCLDHLTRVLGLAPSTLSAHLRHLMAAKLVRVRQEGHWRYYVLPERADDEAGAELRDWLRRYAGESAQVVEDRGRRTVALGESDAPVPSFLKPAVLFLCSGNSCRSQMAEGLLRAKAGDRFEVHSAGLEPREIPATTLAVMDELGIDLRPQQPKSVLTYLGHLSFEYLITVCPAAAARCPVFPGVRQRLCWQLDDPHAVAGPPEWRLAEFRRVRDELAAHIDQWLASLDAAG